MSDLHHLTKTDRNARLAVSALFLTNGALFANLLPRYPRRSPSSSYHAIWSVGALTGGAMAAAAIALDVPLATHLGISALIFSLVTFGAYRNTLPEPDSDLVRDPAGDHEAHSGTRPSGLNSRTILVVMALVMIAIACTIVEDSGNSWAALYLSSDLGATSTVAAFGFIALIGAQFVGRVIGDRLVDAFGQRTVARSGGVLTLVGMGIALAFPGVPLSMIGFACAGFGTATVVPAAMEAADKLPGLRPGTGLTLVSWLMRLGFLLSPPIVGLIADQAGLGAGLLIVPSVGTMVMVLSGVLQGKSSQS